MLAEMKWLANDFLEERKRFIKKRKEVCKEVLAVAKLKKEAKERKRQARKCKGYLICRRWQKSRE